MWKISKKYINKFGEESNASVIKIGNTYAVRRDIDGMILAVGKELKGYVGDIIRTMYDGWSVSEGKYLYILQSDRNGVICKFK